MNNSNIDVSIITPVYKGNIYLKSLFNNIEEAAKKVSYSEVEWIIINDYPEERITALTTNLKNLKIRIINNDSNLGIHQSRINGLKNSKGKYILFLDQDDEITPSALKSHLDNIQNNDVSVTNGFVEDYNHNLKKIFNSKKQLECVKNIKYFFYVGDIIVSPGMVLIKKESIPDIWLYNPLTINGADDWLLWVLLLAQNYKFALCNKITYIHKNNGKNASNNIGRMWHSTEEALRIFEVNNRKYTELANIFRRRIELIKGFQIKHKSKICLYLKNPDILFYVVNYKLIKKYLG